MQKPTHKSNFNQSKGFTLIELIVVIGIMVVLTSVFLVNFSSLRGPRNLKIAAAELSTNFRKIQSYTLSSRDTGTGVPAQYYVMALSKLSIGNRQYIISTIDKNGSQATLETVNLPTDISVNTISIYLPNGSAAITTVECVQVAFKLPFAVTYIDFDNAVDGTCNANFLGSQGNPVTLATMLNRKVTVELKERSKGGLSTVSVNGVSGVIKQP